MTKAAVIRKLKYSHQQNSTLSTPTNSYVKAGSGWQTAPHASSWINALSIPKPLPIYSSKAPSNKTSTSFLPTSPSCVATFVFLSRTYGQVEIIRRIGEVTKLFIEAGVIFFTVFISNNRADRVRVRGSDFIGIYASH